MLIENLIHNLNFQGYSVIENFLSPSDVLIVNEEISSLQKDQAFREASIASHLRTESIRCDWTHWWEMESLTPVQKSIFSKLEDLKSALNQSLYLGLWDFEGHYAIYPTGAFYKKHLDRFKTDDRRKLSVVLYFNESWKINDDGGALEIETQNGELARVSPDAGTLVCFLSETTPHQVLQTHRERKSFAGWYRTRA